MRICALPFVITTSLTLTACAGDDAETGASATETATESSTSTSSTSSATETTATGGTDTAETTGEAAGNGLPEGLSTWTGEAEINNVKVLVEASITNTSGDLLATVTLKDDPEMPAGLGAAQYTLTGTHEPTSGLIALAPDEWTMPPLVDIELVGLGATYEPESAMISGVLVDYATGESNFLTGGPLTLELVDGAGAPTVVGDGAAGLADGSQVFVGTVTCTGAPRDVEATLVYDGAGGVSGTMALGDPGFDSPLGTFSITGVHNPSTGGITLVPGLWEEWFDSKLTFFIDGTFAPESGEFTGDSRVNTGVCADGTWLTMLK
jgi:hypothetical protein